MLHQHHCGIETGRQLLEQHRERRRTASRGADRHQTLARPAGLRRHHLDLATVIALADQPADVLNLAQQRRRRRLRVADAQRRRVHRIERPISHRFENPVHILLDIDGNNHDRARTFRHDPTSCLDAVHHRHEQVHQHHVGRIGGALGHRLGTVAGDPDDLVLRLEGQRAAQRLDGQRHVIDDSDPQPCASPIRTTTASSKASSWKLAFAR